MVIVVITCFNILLAYISSQLINIAVRPVIYYEYILIIILCTWLRNKWLRFSIFAGIVLIDIIHIVAQHFNHNDIDFVLKLPQLFRSSFSAFFWACTLGGPLLLFFAVSKFISILDSTQNRKAEDSTAVSWAYPVITFLIVVCLLDGFNGTASWSSLILNNAPPPNHIKVAGRLYPRILQSFDEYRKGEQPLVNLADYSDRSGQLSPSYKYFGDAGRQLLVIVESWGDIKDTEIRAIQEAVFSDALGSKYLLQFGVTPFYGSTSGAEARELMQKEPAAYYSAMRSGTHGIQTLVSRMKQQKKTTLAFFPFETHYGNAFLFRKQLGFDHIFSIRELRAILPLNIIANSENQYMALDDEVAISEAVRQTSSQPRIFSYVLTINTHLPFRLASKHKHSLKYQAFSNRWHSHFPNETSMDQYYRILTILLSLVHSLKNGAVDEVVVVGC